MNPGVYVIGSGGITVSGNASLTGSGVTYILQGGGIAVSGKGSFKGTSAFVYDTAGGGTSGSINLSGSGTFALSPPTAGPCPGVVIFQPAVNTKTLSISGNALAGVSGTIYAPKAQLALSGNGQIADALVVDTLSMCGNVVVQPTAGNGSAVPIPDPLCPGQTMLSIVGTSLNDVIRVTAGSNPGGVTVTDEQPELGHVPSDEPHRGSRTGRQRHDQRRPECPCVRLALRRRRQRPAPRRRRADAVDGRRRQQHALGRKRPDHHHRRPREQLPGSRRRRRGPHRRLDRLRRQRRRALLSLLNIWTSASYAGASPRIHDRQPRFSLRSGAATVLDGQAADNLFGGTGMDLFFQYPDDKLLQTRPNEIVIKLTAKKS